MQTATLSEAQKHLLELVRGLTSEGALLITDAHQAVARLSSVTVQRTLRQLEPKSVGAVLQPLPAPEHDRLGEMLDARK